MVILDQDIVFINNTTLFPIPSICFKYKKAQGLMTMYSLHSNDVNLHKQDTQEEQISKIYSCLDHDPDGFLLWVPQSFTQQFISFLPEFLIEQYKEQQINFDNGGIGEAFLFHQLNEGLLVECIDPECFSNLFKNCFHTFMNNNHILDSEFPTINDFFYVEECHLMSNIQRLNNTDNGKIMLNILDNNGFKYHISI